MGKIILVTGGARSGKSNFAEKLINERYEVISYIATAMPYDDGMKNRIRKHKESRPANWKTYEIYEELSGYIKEISESCDAVLLDCVTVMLTNLLLKNNVDWDKINMDEIDEIEKNLNREIKLLVDEIIKSKMDAVIVTNEIGCGIVPENRLARIFRDIAGRVNQRMAENSSEVYLAVSGIPVKIK